MFLYLPKLLTAVHELTKTDAGVRAAGFALLAVVGRPAGGLLSDRVGAEAVLRATFVATAVLAIVLAFGYDSMVPLTIACLTLAFALGLGTGAVFKLVAQWSPERVGRRHGGRWRGRRARRLLPTAGHGHRPIRDRKLLPGLRAHGRRGARLPGGPAGARPAGGAT